MKYTIRKRFFRRLATGIGAWVFLAMPDTSLAMVAGFVDQDYRWKSGDTIPVCFVNPTSGNLVGRQMVEYVVKNSWEKVAHINFDFKSAACATTNQGIMIRITDTESIECGSRTTKAGRPVTCTKKENGTAAFARMLLNFTFNNYKGPMSPVAVDSTLRKKQVNRMIFYSAIHEFGHALGFHHENDRAGKDKVDAGAALCSDDDGETELNGMAVSYYDIHSVMHYPCNNAGNWKNGPPLTLSCGDMSTVRWMYGDRNPQIGPKCLKAHATNLALPTDLPAGYPVPAGDYDIGSGADVYESVDSPIYSPIATNGWYKVTHTSPSGNAYPPVEEPDITLSINPETQEVAGQAWKGYRLTFTFFNTSAYFTKTDEAWLEELTLSTIAGPITVYRDIANPKYNKPLWAYSPPGSDRIELTYPIRGTGRHSELDQEFTISSGILNYFTSPTWSIWVPAGQPAHRNSQDEYKVLFQPPLPSIKVQSANDAGLYLADLSFHAVKARFTYWDNAWYESISIKGALPRATNSIQYFFDKERLLTKTRRMWNLASPTRYLQVGVTEVTKADYFFATSHRTPYAPATLDFSGAGLPATGITWYDAIIYCNLRSELEGLEKVYSYYAPRYAQGPDAFTGHCVFMSGLSADFRKNGYRLPTEAEWKDFYSRPASQEYYWPSQENAQDYAWFGNGLTAPVSTGGKRPNSRGLYDLSGNAAEYVWGSESGSMIVAKGGSVTATLADLGKSGRQYLAKYDPNPAVSFRVVRSVRYPFSGLVLSLLFE